MYPPTGLFNCFLLLLLGIYEIYICHHGVLYTESNEAKSWIKNDNLYFGNRKYRRYIASKLPFSNCILFFIIAVSGIIPWFNIGTNHLIQYIVFLSYTSYLTYSSAYSLTCLRTHTTYSRLDKQGILYWICIATCTSLVYDE